MLLNAVKKCNIPYICLGMDTHLRRFSTSSLALVKLFLNQDLETITLNCFFFFLFLLEIPSLSRWSAFYFFNQSLLWAIFYISSLYSSAGNIFSNVCQIIILGMDQNQAL